MKQFKKGYIGIPELLVVTAIIVILTLIALINYPAAKKQLALSRAAYKLAQDIRRAQEMAMSVKEEEGCLNPPKTDYKYGFGISFNGNDPDPNKYILFGDCNGNKKYQPADVDIILFNPDLKDVVVDYSSYVKLDIIFEPPDPTVHFWKDSSEPSEVSIVLKTENDPTKIKTIKINKVGLIYVE